VHANGTGVLNGCEALIGLTALILLDFLLALDDERLDVQRRMCLIGDIEEVGELEDDKVTLRLCFFDVSVEAASVGFIACALCTIEDSIVVLLWITLFPVV
jgi:hypothetical protein